MSLNNSAPAISKASLIGECTPREEVMRSRRAVCDRPCHHEMSSRGISMQWFLVETHGNIEETDNFLYKAGTKARNERQEK